MMKRLIYALTAVLLMSSCGKEENNMTINGNIEGLRKGKLYLQKAEDTLLVTIDSLQIDGNGKFSFSTQVGSPEIFVLYLDKYDGNENNDQLQFFGEPGVINIHTSRDYFESEAEISGSASQDTYESYLKVARKFKSKNLDLIAGRLEALKNGELQKADSMSLALESNAKRKLMYTLNYIFSNKESVVAPYLVLSETPNLTVKYLDSINTILPADVANSTYGIALKDFTERVKKAEELALESE